jgi:2-oxoglutarate dehydrogenase E2 component (dihydrolipoamide succinyltransferase)
VKRVFGVALVGGILLAIVLWVLGRHNPEAGRAAEGPASAAAAPGTAPATAIAAATAAAATAAAAPTAPAATTAPAPAMSDSAACARLAELCSTADKKVDPSECEKDLADGRKLSGAAGVDRTESCLAEAKTCAAASGCVSGGIGMGAMGEFLKGLGSALSK